MTMADQLVDVGRRAIRKHPLVAFLLVTFALPWISAAVTLLWRQDRWFEPAPIWLFTLTVVLWSSPSLAAVLVTAADGGRRSLRAFMARLAPRLLPWRWALFAVVLFPAMHIVGGRIDTLAVGVSPELVSAHPGPGWRGLLVILFMAALSGLREELGWRGWLQGRLQRNFGDFVVAVITGVSWTVWTCRWASTSTWGTRAGLGRGRISGGGSS